MKKKKELFVCTCDSHHCRWDSLKEAVEESERCNGKNEIYKVSHIVRFEKKPILEEVK